MKHGEFWFPSGVQGIEDLLSTSAPLRREIPPPAPIRSSSNSVNFRWVVENWKPGVMKQYPFHFSSGARYIIKNHQPPESTHLEFLFRPQDSVSHEQIWYIEIVVQHAFDFQKAATVYSPLVISPHIPDAKLITPVPLSDIDSFLFVPNTLYIDVKIADEPFGSAGNPALNGSSVVSLVRPIPFAGLLNLGSTGYVNSVLQALFHIPRFRETVYFLNPTTRTIRELQRLFGALHVASKVCSTRLLTQTFQWGETETFQGRRSPIQRDAQSFLRLILNHIRDNSPDPTVASLFTGKIATAIRTLNIDLGNSQVEEFYDVPLEVRGSSALTEAIAKFVEPQLLPVTDPYFRQDQSMGIEFVELPPILIFTLRRSIYNNLTGKREQINDYFSFPEDLDLTKFITRAHIPALFELFGVLVHTGNSISGHHFVFLKIGEQWYHFNDSIVSFATRDQAVGQNFGGNLSTAAYMLFYARKSLLGELFRPCELPIKIRDFVSDIQLRAPTRPSRRTKISRKFTLITEESVRKEILEGREFSEMSEFPEIIELDEGSSNHDLYSQVSVYCDRPLSMILLWKVDDRKIPTVVIPEGPQKCPQKDMILFVQELMEPIIGLPRGMRIALLTFFAQNATPRVQFIGTMTISPIQPIVQIFPFIWSLLEIPNVIFNVYCESYDIFKPIPHNYPLVDLGIAEGEMYLVEPVVPVHPRYQFVYYKPTVEEVISYYSKIRPNGDMTALEYLERRTSQIKIDVFRVSDPLTLVVSISAPELLSVIELPSFVLFATRDQFDYKRDSIQLFRQKLNEEVNDPIPYVLRQDINIRMMFVSVLKHSGETPRLYYDILKNCNPDQLRSMIVRTVEIYDSPCHKLKQIRWPMRPTDPLHILLQYIQSDVYPCKYGRLLIDIDGVVHPIELNQVVDEHAMIRFDVIPADQRILRPNEFLVVALMCRWTKNQDNTPSLGQSFMFKIVCGEPVEAAKVRLISYQCADERLIHWVTLQVGTRTLNGDERLDVFLRPNDTLKVVLPSGSRSKSLLRSRQIE